jgi:phosphonate transport system substrate-binding protein
MSNIKNVAGGSALRIGAVAYDPKVVTIWEGFKAYFQSRGVEIDFILYSNYDAQVDAMLTGGIDVAWNSPLAWVRSQLETRGRCQALVMRDTDRDLTTLVLVRKNSGLTTLADLKEKTVAVGASDSPQATLIPLGMLAEAGVFPEKDFHVLYNNVMVGKHGDHVGGERDAARALASGQADAACVLDANFPMFVNEGTLDRATTVVLAKTPPYDHCNFTALAEIPDAKSGPFVEALVAMTLEDRSVRSLMEMEGLRRWVPGRTTGYGQLENAVKRFRFYA